MAAAISQETLLQSLFLLIAALSLLFLKSLPSRLLRHRGPRPSSAQSQSRRHFITGAQLLSQARAHNPPSQALLRSALSSADAAIAADPRDAAPHILRALALSLSNRKAQALKSLNTALSPPQVKTLGPRETADALVKRAEVQLEVNRRRRVDLAIADLEEAGRLMGDKTGKVLGLMGECYETKGSTEMAMRCYEEALEADPAAEAAREGLERLTKKGTAKAAAS